MKQIKYSIALLALVVFMPANSQYLNPILEYSKEGFYSGPVVLTESHLVYSADKDNISSLWALDLETNTKQKLFTGSIQSLNAHNNLIYFTVEFESNRYNLWSSDGTTVNTQKVSNTVIGRNGLLYTYQGQLLTQNQQLQLHQVQDNQLINLELKLLTPESMCVFGNSDWIALSESQESNTYTLSRKIGTAFDEFYRFNSLEFALPRFIYSGDSCYFSYQDQGELQTIIISEGGEVSSMAPPGDMPNISFFFSHKDRLYAVAGYENVFNSIYRLTPDLRSFDKSATLNNNYVFDTAISKNNLIASRVSENSFEGRSAEVFLDAELNFIPSYFSNTQQVIDIAHEVQSEVINGINSYLDGAVIQTINSNNDVNLMNIQDYYFIKIISNPSSAKFYLTLKNKNTGVTDIFSFTERPVINGLINGIWHEHDISSQGLVIQKGIRNNGSEYIFTTLYTFNQGEPLWLAGIAELLPEQNQLDITLHKYDGIQLLEYNNTPNKEVFGQLKIELESCNRILATFSSEPYNLSLNLYRIDDKSYNYLCNQFKPLPFDSNQSETLMEHNND